MRDAFPAELQFIDVAATVYCGVVYCDDCLLLIGWLHSILLIRDAAYPRVSSSCVIFLILWLGLCGSEFQLSG